MKIHSYIFNRIFMPMFLIVCCPISALILVYTVTELQGSLPRLIALFQELGFARWIKVVCILPTKAALGREDLMLGLGLFMIIQFLLLKFLPGKKEFGPVTPHGHVPEYPANGVISYLISITLYVFLSAKLGLFSPGFVFENLLEIIALMNMFSLLFCVLLYFKGLLAPSTVEHGSSKNFIFDYYWGTELFPKVWGFDIKRWATCRMGLMGWAIMIISYAFYQHETFNITNSIILSVLLQLVYITKFFMWEIGYLRSLDIMHDRAGFYICWGVLVWVPALYTSPTMYMTLHPHNMNPLLFVVLLLLGVLFIVINYHADIQRTKFRKNPDGYKIWGKPAEYIEASYVSDDGEHRVGYLLVSGYWKLARHFHYLPELSATFLWSVGVGFDSIFPFFYFLFLTILLFHRLIRDEKRCSQKYGVYWDEYRKRVPWVIIPGLKIGLINKLGTFNKHDIEKYGKN